MGGRSLSAIGFACVVACGGGREDEGSGTSPSGSGITITPSTGEATQGGDDDDDDGIKLDVGDGNTGGMGGDEATGDGCKKVDFLFVIDSSPSMEDEQANLLTSFPGFINAIETTLMIDDFHLMVVDAGLTLGGGCDGVLGAGRVSDANGNDCGLTGGTRYATQDQADLVDVFSCAGTRGFMGTPNEQTMDSLVASIGPLNAMGECNDGFLRDDAVLVITIITDEEDNPSDIEPGAQADGSCEPVDDDMNSAGDPASWKDAVVQAKSGDQNAVVVLGLTGDCDAGGTCPGIAIDPFDPDAAITGAEPAPRVRAFVDSFPLSTLGPVCAPDYAPFFESAVGVIESACDDFVPPG